MCFSVTALPGDSYHGPHAPLRQRLSVGGGPAQVSPQFYRVCYFPQSCQIQFETDETVVSGEDRRGGPYKTATIIGYFFLSRLEHISQGWETKRKFTNSQINRWLNLGRLGSTYKFCKTLHLGIAQIAIGPPPPRTQPGTLGHFFSGHFLPF